jgi:hypothetical protein
MIDHPARARVAEIVVSRVGEKGTRGSGYLVSSGWVLTACHVVHDATSIGVWLGAPPELVSEEGFGVDVGRVLTVPAADLALLPLGGQAGDPRCEPALFGRLDRDPGPAVPVAAAGCPRFKLRPAPGRPGVLLRELDYAIGSIAALSDAKTDRFAFAMDMAPGPDPEPDKHSPWEGMSGAAVWASNRLIGVVGQHHPREGLATLTVCPVEQLFGWASAAELEAWRTALPRQLTTARDLWLATPPSVRKIETGRARLAAEALTPRVLIGRGAELAILEEFAASDLRWRWLQGSAFAGKTALLAWFTLHPPDNVDIAACFLWRTAGDNTAGYAMNVLTRQLALLADRSGYSPPQFQSELANDLADLLEEASRASHERGNRLIVLIDGLDEYDPAATGLELRDWLPGIRTLPNKAKLLVASRAGADIHLPKGHPLFGYIQHITASEAAAEIQDAASRELNRALKATGGLVRRTVCCLAAAGSGLTSRDLRVLLKRRGSDADVNEIEALLGGFLGRSLKRLPFPSGGMPNLDSSDTQGWVFAHDTLLAEARTMFADDLAIYEELLDGWADEYVQREWPIDTPQYLLRPYTRELAQRAHKPQTADTRRQISKADQLATLGRLLRFATNTARQDRMLARDHNDSAALAEIASACRTVQAAAPAALAELGVLAVAEWRLQTRNSKIPADLPGVWATLGDHDGGEQAALAFTDPDLQRRALIGVATAVGETDPQHARRLLILAEHGARSIADPYVRVQVLSEIAAAVCTIDPEHADELFAEAERWARAIKNLHVQAVALANIATAVAATDPHRGRQLAADAEKIARHHLWRAERDDVAAHIVAAVPDRGEEIARTVRDREDKQLALAGIAASQADANPDQAERAARALSKPDAAARALARVAVAVARVDPDRGRQLADDAEQAARLCTEPQTLAAALAGIAATVAASDPDRARLLATESADTAGAIFDVRAQARALIAIASVLRALIAVDLQRMARLVADAEEASRVISDDSLRQTVAAQLASTQALIDPRAAESTAHTISDRRLQAAVLAEINAIEDPARLEEAVRMLPDPDVRGRALASLATAIAETDPYRAIRLVSVAVRAAESITDEYGQVLALANIAVVIANFDPERSQRLINYAEEIGGGAILDPHIEALTRIATAIALADNGRARRILSDALSAESIFKVLSSLADIDAYAALEICEYALHCLAAMVTDP